MLVNQLGLRPDNRKSARGEIDRLGCRAVDKQAQRGLVVRQLLKQPFGTVGQVPLPVPAGGMRLDRVEELIRFYGPDVMLLVGGSLYLAGDRLPERAAEFVAATSRT